MALEPITRQEKIIAGQDLTPITRMEKFLKQFGGGGGGLPSGGAPYQQLVTDGDGNAKWEDRTHYQYEQTVGIQEESVAFEAIAPGVYMGNMNYPDGVTFTAGQTIKIVFDGQSYDLSCRETEAGTFYGNASIAGTILGQSLPDTGEPFVFYQEDNSFTFMSFSTEAQHTISAEWKELSFHKIDKKYLPEIVFPATTWDEILDKPFSSTKIKATVKGNGAAQINVGNTYSDKINTTMAFKTGFNYKVVGTVALANSSGESYLLSVNGFRQCADGFLILGSIYTSGGKKITVSLYSKEHQYYAGKFMFGSSDNFGKFTITANLTFSVEAKQLDQNVIPASIQRVGDDVILPSSTSGSTKKFKITVDDSGALTATEVLA